MRAKKAVGAESVKEVVGFTVRITRLRKGFQAFDGTDIKALVRLKSAHHSKGNAEVVLPALYTAVSAYLVDVSVEHHHLPVKMLKGSQAEVTVGEQSLRGYRSVGRSLHERSGGRDLIGTMAIDLKILA
jgi:hypothetical protein